MARYDPLGESPTQKEGEDIWKLMACFPGWVRLVAGGLLRGFPPPELRPLPTLFKQHFSYCVGTKAIRDTDPHGPCALALFTLSRSATVS